MSMRNCSVPVEEKKLEVGLQGTLTMPVLQTMLSGSTTFRSAVGTLNDSRSEA